MVPPGVMVYLRVRSYLNGQVSAQRGLIEFLSDTLLSAMMLQDTGLPKLPAPRRYGALPIVAVLTPFPNPSFGGLNRFGYDVFDPGEVTITVSDLIGRYRKTLVSGAAVPGRYWGSFDVSGLQPGAYLLEQHQDGMLTGRGMVMVLK